MKLSFLSLAVGIAAWSPRLFAAEGTVNLTNQNDRISYALGVNFGQNLKNQGVGANLDLVRKGIEDALGGKPQLNEAELRETFNQLRTQMAAFQEEKKKQAKRSEEHTSELQSLAYLVCRLLL